MSGASPGGFGASFNTSFSDIQSGLLGEESSGTTTGTSTEAIDSTKTEAVKIDEIGLLKMIEDALKGVSGLSEIFGAEAGAGLFGSSVAKEGTEDLIAKIAGELAKVTGVRTSTEVGTKDVASTETKTAESAGAIEQLDPFSSSMQDTFRGLF